MGITTNNISNKVYSIKTKGEARQFAIEFKEQMSEDKSYWSEVIFYQRYLTILARKFNLIREFKREAII